MSCVCCVCCGVERGADYPREGFRKWQGSNGPRLEDICLDCLRQIPEYTESLEKLLAEAVNILNLAGMTICVLGDGAVSTDMEGERYRVLAERIKKVLAGGEE